MKIRVTTQFKVGGDSDLDRHTDELIDALIEIEKEDDLLSEADVNAAIRSRLVNVTIVVDAANWAGAESHANDVINRALEMTGAVLVASQDVDVDSAENMHASIQSTELVPA